jgi:predicted NodU family carbamoyl transferase
VLGIVYEHDATVCLMEDGKIVFCQSEERFDRVKQSFGYHHVAPRESIDLSGIRYLALGLVLLAKRPP